MGTDPVNIITRKIFECKLNRKRKKIKEQTKELTKDIHRGSQANGKKVRLEQKEASTRAKDTKI